MTKAELIGRIGSVTGFPMSDVRILMDAFLEISRQELIAGGSVSLSPIGSLHPHTREARSWRHPTTKAIHELPARRSIKFRLGKAVRDGLN